MIKNLYSKMEEAGEDGAASGSAGTTQEISAEQKEIIELKAALKETREEAAGRRIKLKEFEGVDANEYAELKELKASLKQKELESSGNFEAAKAAIVESFEAKLLEKENALKTLTKKHKQSVVNDVIISNATKLGAINPSQVSMLLRDNIRMGQDGVVEVLNDSGTATYNAKGNLLSVNEYVESFLTENKYLIKAGSTGTGSDGGSHKPSNNSTPQERMKAGLEKLLG